MFYTKMRQYLQQILGFQAYPTEPCLLKKDKVVAVFYVDDLIVVGENSQINEFKERFTHQVKTRHEEQVTEYIGCEMKWDTDGNGVILHQTRIAMKIIETLKEDINVTRDYNPPSVPGVGIKRCADDYPRMSSYMQDKFRSAIGTMLYLTKFSRPDMSNTVRDLSEVIDEDNIGHYKQMVRASKFISIC